MVTKAGLKKKHEKKRLIVLVEREFVKCALTLSF